MLETSVLGLGQDLGLLSVLRFMRWLAGYRFSCCDFNLIRTDLKSAIGSRLIRLVWYESSISPDTNFKQTVSAWPKFQIFYIARFYPCVGYLRIRMIRVHLFKMADVFVGASRRAGCKYSLKFYCRVWTVIRIVSILTLATSRCYFEDYAFVLSSEWFFDSDKIWLLTRI